MCGERSIMTVGVLWGQSEVHFSVPVRGMSVQRLQMTLPHRRYKPVWAVVMQLDRFHGTTGGGERNNTPLPAI